MLVQISGGSGPVECSIAVEKLCHSLLEEYEGAKLVSFNADYSGKGYKSAVLDFDSNVNDIPASPSSRGCSCRSPRRRMDRKDNSRRCSPAP